ncbi:MAG: hypothetical protein IIC82_02315 [Chloroflexi bacterium]|nr:hypothetical protein [Chloroflexota bacterium]
MSELTGAEAKIVHSEKALGSVGIDTTKMHQLIGRTKVPWKDGLRRMVEARHPELLTKGAN